ncbi:unnamed protein product [Anisakis simplex]|uniref:Uncharacterized protein n=1 Tax=Anisakis simplex TaxID=6269 RepID=A0A0M3JGD3_ANISI|nr:unnamed protein product [Anisakis simplex]
MNTFADVEIKNLTLLNFVNNLRQRNLVLDYRLLSNPVVAAGAIDMLAKGEISWYLYAVTCFL